MPISLTKRLQEAIKTREANGETINAIAAASGVAQAQLWHFMKGTRDIRLATADRLASYLALELTESRENRTAIDTKAKRGAQPAATTPKPTKTAKQAKPPAAKKQQRRAE